MAHNEEYIFRGLKPFFKTNTSESINLNISKIEQIIGKTLPSVSKGESAKDTLWNNYSPASEVWKISGYFIESYDHETGEVIFYRDTDLSEDLKKLQKEESKRDFVEDLVGILPKFLFYSVAIIFCLFLSYKLSDTSQDQNLNEYCKKYYANYPLRDRGDCEKSYKKLGNWESDRR